VEAIEPSGSAVAKSMFLLRASCGLMKERGHKAFRTERLSLKPLRFIVHFVAPESPGHEAPDPAKGEQALVSAAWCDRLESIFTQ
jgi:hypothetical protein